ncbi:MAG: hypothetical protein SYR96_31465 [Actinomycetota bacterium]|nr:hypothetical protein [Actinomycetota bacterium]
MRVDRRPQTQPRRVVFLGRRHRLKVAGAPRPVTVVADQALVEVGAVRQFLRRGEELLRPGAPGGVVRATGSR